MRAFVRYIADVIAVSAMIALVAGLLVGYFAFVAALYVIITLASYLSDNQLTKMWNKICHVRNTPTNRGPPTPPRRHP